MAKSLYLPYLDLWTKGSPAFQKDVKIAERALALFETVDLESAGHDYLIHKVVETLEGDIIAETEWGLLGRFKDPLHAALAALNLKRAAKLMNLKTRAAITWGAVPAGKDRGSRHLRNETARRCARMFAIALPHQILVDDDLRDAVRGRFSEYPELMLSEPARVELEGVGREDLMELSSSDLGFAAPTDHHIPSLGDIEISPVQTSQFPDDTDPSQYLICDTCEKPMAPDGSDGMLVIEREGDVIQRFSLFHKGDCDTLQSHAWRDLTEFTNPEAYVQFLVALFNNWAIRQLKIEDAEGLVKLVMGMYRRVFRPTTSREHLNFIGIMRLIRLMGE